MRKRLGIFVALVAALSFGIAQAAQIDGLQTNSGPDLPAALDVYVNPGDLGDALIGGYYNARGNFNFISLVNTSTTEGVSVKVRFREGKYSNEVLDFFVCLSAGDRWTAWVFGDTNEDNPAYILVWDDDTPTYPDFGSDNLQEFKSGTPSCVTPDMTKEGYFTVIGVSSWLDTPGAMKVVSTDAQCGEATGIAGANADDFCVGAADCDIVAREDVENVLVGTVIIYDVAGVAGAYGYNMTALADFRDTVVGNPGLGVDDPPTLADAGNSLPPFGLDAVNYALTKDNLIALYDIESVLTGQSDVIITFPTKRLTLVEGATWQQPFQGSYDVTPECEWLDACEPVTVSLWDDEENSPEVTTGFSPTTTTELELCNEVNYITIGESGAVSLLDTDLLQFRVGQSGFDIGWVNFNFTSNNLAAQRQIALPNAATPDATAYGLPVIGYELGSFLQEFYTHMLPLRYTTDIRTAD
jgi:hypothetical protein